MQSTIERSRRSSAGGRATPDRGPGRKELTLAGSLSTLLVTVVGVPLVLAMTGASNPVASLYRSIRTVTRDPRHLSAVMVHPIGDGTVAGIAVAMAWATWAWLVVCILAELVARLRGAPVRRLPVSNRLQGLVTVLFGASLALLAPGRAAVANAPAGAAMASFNEQPGVPAAPSPGTDPVRDLLRADGTAIAPVRRTYVVQRGDTLWSIAATQLGSPLLWREIAEMNLGHSQPGGLVFENAGWILPGWELRLPVVASAEPPVVATSVSNSQSQRPSTAPPPRTVTMRRGPQVRAPAAGTGPVLVTRRVPLRVDHRADALAKGLQVKTPGPAASYAQDWGLPAAPIGYGLMGAGVVALLVRLRRVQQRHRPEGRNIALPDHELSKVERRLRLGADVEAADWVDVTLRLLSARTQRMGERPPQVVALRVLPGAVELVLDPDRSLRPPPAPFESGSDGTSWFLPRIEEVLERFRNDPWTSGSDASCPALVTLGRGTLGDVLVDLERVGSMAVTGPRAAGVLRSMAVELATAPWSDQVDVSLVGFGGTASGSALAGFDRVRLFSSVPDLMPQLERLVTARADLLSSLDYRTTWPRGGYDDDLETRDLVVVLCSEAAVSDDSRAAAELVHLAADGANGIVAVCAGAVAGARWRVEAGDEPIVIEAGTLREAALWPQHLDASDAVGIASLVEVAQRLDGVPPDAPPYDELFSPKRVEQSLGHIAGPTVASPTPGSTDGDEGVVVLVLGPTTVHGAYRPFTRAWALELVVYLAMHPEGASRERWSTALWPERLMAPSSLHSTVSAARRSLGVSPSGEDHLPRGHGRLALGPGVTSDWARFSTLAASDDVEDWSAALELIRGRPFEGLRSSDWTILEGVTAMIEASVVDLAERFSRRRIADGAVADAEWGARQGLLVSPYDERLYRSLMRAADAAGNPAGVESVMAELVQLVSDELEPYDAVHHETYDLYRRLSRRHLTPSSPS